jgi:hypothetical protein
MLNYPNHVAHHIVAAWLNAGDPTISYDLTQLDVEYFWDLWVSNPTQALRSDIRAFLDNTWGTITPPTV